MRDLVAAGYVDRRPGSGTFVRLQEAHQASLIGLLIPDLGETEVFEPICGEIVRACQQHKLSVVWGDSSSVESNSQEQRAVQLCERYIEQRMAGVFFAPIELSESMSRTNTRIAESLTRAGIAVVLLDRDIVDLPGRSRFDVVGIDNFRAGMVLTQHLLDQQAKNIVYIARQFSAATVERRIAGYEFSLAQNSARQKPVVMYGEPDNFEFIDQLMAARPDAIVCANDQTAAQVQRALNVRGINVPDQVRIVGLDDVNYAELLAVPLTTLRQPCREIGAAAVRSMVERLENRTMPARDVYVKTELVVRQSCGARLT